MSNTAEKLLEETTTEDKPNFVKPGWYRDMSNEDYHGGPGTSSSNLKVLMQKTPAHLKHQKANRKPPTDNMKLGTAVHCLVLEPEKFNDEIAVLPSLDRRTKKGKEEYENFKIQSEGKTIITAEQHDKARFMAESVLTHPDAGHFLEDVLVEQSIYWWYRSGDVDDDTQYKELLKVRPDALSKTYAMCIDLKTTDDATETAFMKSIEKYYYHLSAAMYLEGINQCQPLLKEMGHFAYTNFLIIAVENQPPFLSRCIEIMPEYLRIGREHYRRAVQRLHEARRDNWPGFPRGAAEFYPSNWADKAPLI